MEDFKKYGGYLGAIIGLVVGIVIIVCRIQEVIEAIVIIVGCALLGAYVQKNKDLVKEKLKKFIDKI